MNKIPNKNLNKWATRGCSIEQVFLGNVSFVAANLAEIFLFEQVFWDTNDGILHFKVVGRNLFNQLCHLLSNLRFFWVLNLIRNNSLLRYNLSRWLDLAFSSVLVLIRLGSFYEASGSPVSALKGSKHRNRVNHRKTHYFFLHELAIQHFDVVYVVSELLFPL